MSVALIQGASRGIGLQYCRSLLKSGVNHVIATCRQPVKATELSNLSTEFSKRLTLLKLDVTDEKDIILASETVSERFGKVDLLINSAGILHPSGRGETSLKSVTAEGLEQTYRVNTVGPLLMAKHFSSLLAKGDGNFGKDKTHKAILVNMSAKVGSITDNGLGGWYSYRLSKAALNMATKNLSIELGRGNNKVICVCLHPGTVDTDLSKPYHKNVKNLFTAEHSVNLLLDLIDNLSIEDTGNLFLYDGSVFPF